MDNIDVDHLAHILRKAKVEHTEFEENLGHPDDNWAEWYADYILNRLEEELEEES